jgi:hypothetical protein
LAISHWVTTERLGVEVGIEADKLPRLIRQLKQQSKGDVVCLWILAWIVKMHVRHYSHLLAGFESATELEPYFSGQP